MPQTPWPGILQAEKRPSQRRLFALPPTGISEDIGTLLLEPKLDGPSRRPLGDSPMIDAGRELPVFQMSPVPFDDDWEPGDIDAAGQDRSAGSTIDMGAVEVPMSFRNGIE